MKSAVLIFRDEAKWTQAVSFQIATNAMNCIEIVSIWWQLAMKLQRLQERKNLQT